MTDRDYADNIELLANTWAQREYQLHTLEQAVESIRLYVNTNKAKYVYFNRKAAISILSGKPLKLVEQFTYPSNNISSTEIIDNVKQAKPWNVIDRLKIIWKSNLRDKIKCDVFQVESPVGNSKDVLTWMVNIKILLEIIS